MKRCLVRDLFWSLTFIALCPFLSGQQPATGLPPLGSFSGGGLDTVNLANLNVHFSIPIFSRPGKGIPFSYSLTYDSLIWEPVASNGAPSWQPVNSNWGWRSGTEVVTGWVEWTSDVQSDDLCSETWSGFIYHDPSGGVHPTTASIYDYYHSLPNCRQPDKHGVYPGVATDNSGYSLTPALGGTTTVQSRGGLTIVAPVQTSLGSGSVTDPNNNTITTTYTASTQTTTITDTLGSTALTIRGLPPTNAPTCTNATGTSNVTYTYAAPAGNASVTVSYAGIWLQTNFQVTGIAEYPVTPKCLVNRVTYPDGSYYQFNYEATVGNGISGKFTGRPASITLPTSGTITYSYAGTGCGNGNNSNCMMTDGSPSSMSRTLAGTNINTGTWNYTRAVQNTKQLPQTTTSVTDPYGNLTALLFSGVYETDRKIYQGSTTLLDHSFICYVNGEDHSLCSAATVSTAQPITFRAKIDYPNDNGHFNSALQSFYDAYGNTTGGQAWDFGNDNAHGYLQQSAVTYDASLCSSKNICDHPSEVKILDGTNVIKSDTTYQYDNGNNTNGNLTLVSKWVSNSSPNLVWQYSYNTQSGAGGSLATATDPNNTVTSYSYAGSSCNGAFPTSVTVGGLTTQYQYNCAGGVVTSITDSNNAHETTSYTDSYFWRPASTTDPLNNTTAYSYISPNQVESAVTFNGGGSTADKLTTLDALGRLSLSQTREGPGSSTWDTTEYIYNGSGEVSWITLPFPGPAGQTQGNLPATEFSYDALGRYLDISGGPWSSFDTHYTYNFNDVEVTLNPAPSGENAKSRQLEFDVLGRVKSVCEMTTMSGSGSCLQQSGQTGFYTSYAYDPLGDLTSVSQSGQSRTFTYDGLSRTLTESNPESGTTTYTYDSIAGSYCAGSASTSAGDLVGKGDAATPQNHVCYYYDTYHRLTAIGNNNQSASNPCLRFRYDNTTPPSGINVTNYWGRMVEAKTDNCGAQGDPTITDEWFNYNARGDTTDVWESTPNSGGWYHIVDQPAANRALASRTGYLGTGTTNKFSDTFNYAFDGEGRPNGVSDHNGYGWASGYTHYNAMSEPDQLYFLPSTDTEGFTWDPNTGRIATWSSSVGTGQQTGTLGWNANGTLGSLNINDSGNIQNCAYTYDDLARLSSANCGTPWSQTFNYDTVGNIWQYGSSIFNQGYGSGNHVIGFSYDGDGNVTNDGSNTYSYNVYGRPATSAGVTATYDAFLRAVEVGGVQFVYAPNGYKFAKMNGQTVNRYFVAMAAGAQLVYNATGLDHYRHSDWLGRHASPRRRGN